MLVNLSLQRDNYVNRYMQQWFIGPKPYQPTVNNGLFLRSAFPPLKPQPTFSYTCLNLIPSPFVPAILCDLARFSVLVTLLRNCDLPPGSFCWPPHAISSLICILHQVLSHHRILCLFRFRKSRY